MNETPVNKYDHLFAALVQMGQARRAIIRAMIQASFRILPSLEGFSWADIREKLGTALKAESRLIIDDRFLDTWTFFIELLLEIPREHREMVKRRMLANWGE